MADNFSDFDEGVRELSDEELVAVSGGRKLLCPKGTIKVCATRDGVYKCLCEPLVTAQQATEL